jgi:hypothetical protein
MATGLLLHRSGRRRHQAPLVSLVAGQNVNVQDGHATQIEDGPGPPVGRGRPEPERLKPASTSQRGKPAARSSSRAPRTCSSASSS